MLQIIDSLILEAAMRIELMYKGFVYLRYIPRRGTDLLSKLRRGRDSNPRMVVLQTTALPLRHRAIFFPQYFLLLSRLIKQLGFHCFRAQGIF